MAVTQMRRRMPPLPYLDRFRLADQPFAVTANPRYAYARESHIEAVNKLRNVVIGKAALGICSGNVGLGKTTIARLLAEDLRSNDIATVFLPAVPGGTRQSDAAIIGTLIDEFKLKRSPSNSSAQHYSTLGQFARSNDDAGSTTVVIFDDAQLLRSAGVRAILQLLALQTTEAGLVQIILFGQNPELLQAVTGNPALHTRVSANVELTPFAEEEVAAMIKHRLKVAQRSKELFTPGAIHQLTVSSSGIPRTICHLAHSACINACERESDVVDVRDVEQAASELLHSGEAQ